MHEVLPEPLPWPIPRAGNGNQPKIKKLEMEAEEFEREGTYLDHMEKACRSLLG